jgi:hypothetical protein
MKKIMFVAAFVTSTFAAGWAQGSDTSSSDATIATRITQDTEARDAINRALAPIRSATQFAAYMATLPANSPMRALAPLDRALLSQSLDFGPDGLLSYDATTLQGLTVSQAYQVLALFGAQGHTVDIKAPSRATLDSAKSTSIVPMLEPLKGFRCIGGHSCGEDAKAACTDHC